MALPISPLPELDVCAFGSQGQLWQSQDCVRAHPLKGEEGGVCHIVGVRKFYHYFQGINFC